MLLGFKKWFYPFLILLYVAMIAIGVINKNDCPINANIPVILVLLGKLITITNLNLNDFVYRYIWFIRQNYKLFR